VIHLTRAKCGRHTHRFQKRTSIHPSPSHYHLGTINMQSNVSLNHFYGRHLSRTAGIYA